MARYSDYSGSTGCQHNRRNFLSFAAATHPTPAALNRNCRLTTQCLGILAAQPLPRINFRSTTHVEASLLHFLYLLCTLYSALCTFWMFPSSTTTTPAVLETCRNIRKNLPFFQRFSRIILDWPFVLYLYLFLGTGDWKLACLLLCTLHFVLCTKKGPNQN
jgi:hypothetical protein